MQPPASQPKNAENAESAENTRKNAEKSIEQFKLVRKSAGK